MKNYYEILQVNQNASLEIIEKAYKVLAKRYHPDIQTDAKKKAFAETRLKEINEAYDVLSDEFLREQYDLELEKQTKQNWEQAYQNQTYSVDRNSYARNKSSVQNQTNQQSNSSQENVSKRKEKKQKSTMGTFEGLVELVKQLYHDRPKREEFKEMTKKDIFAIVLTIIIVILLGFALWFIPFTNGWMRELLFENPLFNWIGRLF